jgi:hypothetical protein
VSLSGPVTAEPFAHESLTSYVRRVARQEFFADPVAFLRAGGVEWRDRSRDPDLLTGAFLQQVGAFFGLELNGAAKLTLHSYLRHLSDEDRRSLRWWTMLTQRTRMCDRCVVERSYGRAHWRLPVVTECLIHRRPLLDECRLCGSIRDRSSRRWERFDCGHHVQRSADADSLPVDLRVQQAIQASVGIGSARSTGTGLRLIHTALSERPRPVDVQSVRESLREVWVEHRRVRLAWRGPAQVIKILEQRGERLYPTQRKPPATDAPLELVSLSRQELHDIVAQFASRLQNRSRSTSDVPVATIRTPPVGQVVAVQR